VEHAAGAACPQLVRAVRYLSRGPASRQVLRNGSGLFEKACELDLEHRGEVEIWAIRRE